MTERIRLRSSTIRRNGTRGYVISIPGIWVENESLALGDQVNVFQNVAGELVVTKAPKPVPSSAAVPPKAASE